MISTSHGSFSARKPSIAAVNSMRLFVVCASDPNSSRLRSPYRRIHAHPPGPGLPRHAPSVISLTFFSGPSGRDGLEFPIEKSIDLVQNLSGFGRLVNFDAQFRPVAYPVREVGRKLLHFSDRVRLLALE